MIASSCSTTNNTLRKKWKIHKIFWPLDEVYSQRIQNLSKWYTWMRRTSTTLDHKKNRSDLRAEWTPKTKTHPSIYQEKFHIIHHPDHLHVFTDGSKDNEKTACATVLNKTIIKNAHPIKSSIFTAEARAIDIAPDTISKNKHKKFIIFIDSLSV